jgi:hypothetical protein
LLSENTVLLFREILLLFYYEFLVILKEPNAEMQRIQTMDILFSADITGITTENKGFQWKLHT